MLTPPRRALLLAAVALSAAAYLTAPSSGLPQCVQAGSLRANVGSTSMRAEFRYAHLREDKGTPERRDVPLGATFHT